MSALLDANTQDALTTLDIALLLETITTAEYRMALALIRKGKPAALAARIVLSGRGLVVTR